MNLEKLIQQLTPEAHAILAAEQDKFEKLRAAKLRERDFTGYLVTFESHERLQPFMQILPLLTDAEYWKQVRDIWMMSEVVEPDRNTWLHLLRDKRPCREFLMTDEERTAVAAMPDEIKIWRGCGHQSAIQGMSWTTDKSRAEFFAHYACEDRRAFLTGQRGMSPIVVEATCSKPNILAYFLARNESEIVLNPSEVNLIKP